MMETAWVNLHRGLTGFRLFYLSYLGSYLFCQLVGERLEDTFPVFQLEGRAEAFDASLLLAET
ncbi:MAG: hypothetical protein ACFFD4_12525 [Candidatus Odinarchaeota archaeon]